jgi:dTDP-4-dehydrorhamnose reductase
MTGPKPRPTLVAKAALEMAQSGAFAHPVLDTPGWWARDTRFIREGKLKARNLPARPRRPILITGATGTLGRALLRICGARGLHAIATTRTDLDITSDAAIDQTMRDLNPWAVINAAGFVRVADAAQERDRCYAENTTGPERLAQACAARDLPFVTFSSDLVFDGQGARPYLESDTANPLCTYGTSKHAAEQLVTAAWDKSRIIRTSAFFGPWDRYNFVWSILNRLHRGTPVTANAYEIVSPTYVPDLVHGTLDLLLDGEQGLWHLTNPCEISWFDLARAAARHAQLDTQGITAETSMPPRSTALTTARGLVLPPLDKALFAYARDNEMAWAA